MDQSNWMSYSQVINILLYLTIYLHLFASDGGAMSMIATDLRLCLLFGIRIFHVQYTIYVI
jgi:hypothetical protein